MKRRKFLLASGASVIAGSATIGSISKPVVGLTFELSAVPNYDATDVNSLLVQFDKFVITPAYLDESDQIEFTVELTSDSNTVREQTKVNFTNGSKLDASKIWDQQNFSILMDGISNSKDELSGSVKITVNHSDIPEETYSDSFDISNNSPTADISSVNQVDVDQQFTLDGGNSSDPDGDSVSYKWDIDDDGKYEKTGESITHTYTSEGTKRIQLKVEDGNGGTATATKSVSVSRSAPTSSGGNRVVEKAIDGSTYRLHVFEDNGTFNIDGNYNNAYVLVVGGGGGGGQGEGGGGGGGGGGGVAVADNYSLSSGSYNISVGAGGAGGNLRDDIGEEGNRGGNSVFDVGGIEIVGKGGGGGAAANDNTDATNGGSGGGSADKGSGGAGDKGFATQPNTNGSGITDYGNDGGRQSRNDTGAGGGGATESGASNSGSDSGRGGDGVDLTNKFSSDFGDNGVFGGGGGGASNKSDTGGGSAGSGGDGGGGRGTDGGSIRDDGTDGTGGGGGAGVQGYGGTGRDGGDGGNGIVIVRIGPL